tara:strand:- start:563 stop:796 length:234 start_codon:yes stop_codon:yes gene_type:complete
MEKQFKLEKIKKAFKRVFPRQKIDKNFIKLKTGNVENWDSLRNLNLILEIEKEFKIKFDAKVFSNIKSIQDLISNIK